jgi:hypothetical protein
VGKRITFGKVYERILRGVRFYAILAVGSLVSMGIGFAAVHYLIEKRTPPETAPESARLEAEALFTFKNELLRLTAEFQERQQEEALFSSPEFATWLSNDFRPRLNDLRRRMLDPSMTGEALRVLTAAADQVAAAASQPASDAQRQRATDAVFAAVDAAEARIQALGMSRQVGH